MFQLLLKSEPLQLIQHFRKQAYRFSFFKFRNNILFLHILTFIFLSFRLKANVLYRLLWNKEVSLCR